MKSQSFRKGRRVLKGSTTITITLMITLGMLIAPILTFQVTEAEDSSLTKEMGTLDSPLRDMESSISKESISEKLPSLMTFFTENTGQLGSEEILFFFQQQDFGVGFTDNGVIYKIRNPQTIKKDETSLFDTKSWMDNPEKNEITTEEVVILRFEGANEVQPRGRGLLPHQSNYFRGNDPSSWLTSVRSYSEVIYPGIYDGIDLVYRFNDEGLKYEFVVSPGVNPDVIKLRYEGIESLSINSDGALVAQTVLSSLIDKNLFIFQDISCSILPVDGDFVVNDQDSFGFQVTGSYLHHLPLIIDPLIFSTLIGSSKIDSGNDIAVDSANNIYVTGETAAPATATPSNFPTTPGAFSTTHGGPNGYNDAFIFKLSSDGSTLLFSTFIGGSNNEYSYGITLDHFDNVYITGATKSSNFPTTTLAYNKTHAGDGIMDVFVVKLARTGNFLYYSTFLGGISDEYGQSIALDSGNNAYVTGYTGSPNFPTTPGVSDTTHNGQYDAFVSKLDKDGTSLLFSTFVGGLNSDRSYGIAVDSMNNTYITGATFSSNFPVTSGAYDTTHGGDYDVFVSKLNSDFSSLTYSTFVGHTAEDQSQDIAIDESNVVYVTGYTFSSNFPTTSNAYNKAFGGGQDAFIFKLSSDGSSLVYSTFVGGNNDDVSNSIAIDSLKNIYLAGTTESSDFPTTPGAFDRVLNNLFDIYVLKLNSDGASVVYSSFVGGKSQDYARGIALDSANNVYVTGTTTSTDFSTTSGVFNETHNGLWDIFVFSADVSEPILELITPENRTTHNSGTLVQLRAKESNQTLWYSWNGVQNNTITTLPCGSVFLNDWGSYGTNNGEMDIPWGVAVNGTGYIYVTDTKNNRIQVFDQNGNFVKTWGSYGTSGGGVFRTPMGVAINSTGYVYVADTTNHRIQVFDASGINLTEWGSYGTSSGGQFKYPRGIAVNKTGYVYVVDSSSNEIEVFDANGNFVTMWGGGGLDDGKFNFPYAIAVNATGFVYVADRNNYRIQVFDANGNFVTKWGSQGTLSGEFWFPWGIAVDSSGHVYVADVTDHIQVFDAMGNFLTKWGSFGAGDGQLDDPAGVAINATGHVYVVDSANNRIQVFSPTFVCPKINFTLPAGDGINVLSVYAVDNAGNWNHENFQFITDDTPPTLELMTPTNGTVKKSGNLIQLNISKSNGNLWYSWNGETNSTIDLPICNTTYSSEWGSSGSKNGQFNYPHHVAVNTTGYVFISDSNNYRIQVFDPYGKFITSWGTAGSGDGEFDKPYGIAFNSSGYLYVADSYNHRIQVFDANGNFVTKWGSQGSDDSQFNNPVGVAINTTGYVYVTDYYNHRIQVFDANGNFVTTWGNQGSQNGNFSYPTGVAVNASGYIFTVGYYNNRIQVFDAMGNFITKWGSFGSGDGQFGNLHGISISNTGYIYVTDRSYNRIQVFDANGNFVAKWGSPGTGASQFDFPWGIAVTPDDNVYVVDMYNARVQVFTPTFCPLRNFTFPVGNDLHTLDVFAVDEAGNWVHKYFEFITDDAPPSLNLVTPTNKTTHKSGTLVQFNVVDSNGTFWYSWDGITNSTVSTALVNLNLPAGDGNHTLDTYAVDNLGNWNHSYYEFTTDAIYPWSTTPSGGTYIRESSVTIEWIGYDDRIPGQYVVYKNGSLYKTDSWINATGISIPLDTFQIGMWNYNIQFNDSVGNPGTPITVWILIEDVVPPTISGVSHNPPSPTSDDQVVVTADVTDDVAVDTVLLYYSSDDGATWQSVVMVSGSTYSATIGPFPGGTFVNYYVWAEDTSDNSVNEPSSAPAASYSFIVKALTTSQPTTTTTLPITKTTTTTETEPSGGGLIPGFTLPFLLLAILIFIPIRRNKRDS